MISAVKDGRPGDGFVAAVELCGAELARHFPPGALDRDELPNKVVEILKRTLQVSFSLLVGATLLEGGSLGLALAQVNCEAFPPGPQRTDCYIGLSRINRQKSEISAHVARQQAETAIYRQVTGKRPNKKRRRAMPAS